MFVTSVSKKTWTNYSTVSLLWFVQVFLKQTSTWGVTNQDMLLLATLQYVTWIFFLFYFAFFVHGPNFSNFDSPTKVIHTQYSNHRPSTVAHTFECVCSNINHGLNHGLFISLLKLINCPIH